MVGETFEIKESRRKRQTIRIKLPRKPAAPRKVPRATVGAFPVAHIAGPSKAKEGPLRINCFVIVALLALAYCNFFFEFIRGVPLHDDLPAIFWPQVVQKLLGIALLVGFGLFERTHKELTLRSRWLYCIVLAFGTAFFAVQCVLGF